MLTKSAAIVTGKHAFILSGSERTTDAGEPIRRYRKDLIRVGDTVRAVNGEEVTITRDDLEHWIEQFRLMQEAGVPVPAVKDHSSKIDDKLGDVVDLFIDGDTLYAAVDLIGEEAIKLAGKAHVSIFVPSTWRDSEGNEYDSPIAHVGLVATPQVTGQGRFTAIAASNHHKRVPVYTTAKPRKEKTMPDDFNNRVLQLSAQNRTGRIDLAVQRGKITAAQGKELKQAWIGDEENEYAGLMLTAQSTELDDLFTRTMDIIEKAGQGVPTGDQTGPQMFRLEQNGGDGEQKKNTKPSIVAKAEAMAEKEKDSGMVTTAAIYG